MTTALKPRLALTLGDPAGIGGELVARQLADPASSELAEIFLISDEAELAQAQEDAGVTFDWSRTPGEGLPVLVDNAAARPEQPFERRKATEAGGTWAMANLRKALEQIAAARDANQIWMTTPGAICAHAALQHDTSRTDP